MNKHHYSAVKLCTCRSTACQLLGRVSPAHNAVTDSSALLSITTTVSFIFTISLPVCRLSVFHFYSHKRQACLFSLQISSGQFPRPLPQNPSCNENFRRQSCICIQAHSWSQENQPYGDITPRQCFTKVGLHVNNVFREYLPQKLMNRRQTKTKMIDGPFYTSTHIVEYISSAEMLHFCD